MFFNEYALTPHVFEKSYCESDVAIQKDLIYFLRGLKRNGLLANINKDLWQQEVLKHLRMLSPKVKDKLSHLLQELKKSNRLVLHESIIEDSLDGEHSWLDLMLREDEIKPYAALVQTGNIQNDNQNITTLENLLERDEWCNNVDDYIFIQTKENLALYLSDFLMYARKLTISDPYFTYNRLDEEALYIFAELFAKHRDIRMKNRKLIIHTSYNEKDYNVDITSDKYKVKWIKVFQDIYKKYGHYVTLNVWKDTNRIKSMHDRFMVTDQGGLHSGRGFGIMPAESIWTLLTENTMRSCLNIYEENVNSGIKFMFSVTKDSIVKKKVPLSEMKTVTTKSGIRKKVVNIDDN